MMSRLSNASIALSGSAVFLACQVQPGAPVVQQLASHLLVVADILASMNVVVACVAESSHVI